MMLSIDRQAEKIRRRDELIHQLYLLVITLASIIVVLAILIFAMTHSAAANNVCLTKQEARVLWPTQHIYWYSKNHCWSNRRGGPPRNIKIDPIIKVMAQAPILPAPVYDVLPRPRPDEDYCCWPPLEELTQEALREQGLRILMDHMKGGK